MRARSLKDARLESFLAMLEKSGRKNFLARLFLTDGAILAPIFASFTCSVQGRMSISVTCCDSLESQ